MASQQAHMSSDGFTSHIAGMSKSQLYDIMSQMKLLIEQNQQQARKILIDNPTLTRALFQAQIMLGMVKPKNTTEQQPQSAQAGPQQNVPSTQSLPVQSAVHGQTSLSQPVAVPRQQQPSQPSISLPSASVPPLTYQPHMTSNPPQSTQQTKGFFNPQVLNMSLPQSSQVHNVPLPQPLAPHYSLLQSHMPIGSSQTQPNLQNPGLYQQPLQPPLPQQPRPPSMQPFLHQIHSQMPHSVGFQPSIAPQQHLSQSLFHAGGNPPSSFPQGQPPLPSQPLPSQPPPQQLYQGSSHVSSDFNNQMGSSMQAERLAPWIPGLPEKATGGPQLPGPPSMHPGQMAPGLGGGQPPRPPPLTPDMEKALLQQVMSLTPDQINLLPPEQRNQVIQLQEMLR